MARTTDGSSANATNDLIIAPTDALEEVNVEGEVSYRGSVDTKTAGEEELSATANSDDKITLPETTDADDEAAKEELQNNVHSDLVSPDDVYRLKDEIDWNEAARVYKEANRRGTKTAMSNFFLRSTKKGIRNGDVPFVTSICKVIGSSAVNSIYPNAASQTLRKNGVGSNMSNKQLVKYTNDELIPQLKEITPSWDESELEKEDGTKEKVPNLTAHSTSSKSTKKAMKTSTGKEAEESTWGSMFTVDNLESLNRTYKKFT